MTIFAQMKSSVASPTMTRGLQLPPEALAELQRQQQAQFLNPDYQKITMDASNQRAEAAKGEFERNFMDAYNAADDNGKMALILNQVLPEDQLSQMRINQALSAQGMDTAQSGVGSKGLKKWLSDIGDFAGGLVSSVAKPVSTVAESVGIPDWLTTAIMPVNAVSEYGVDAAKEGGQLIQEGLAGGLEMAGMDPEIAKILAPFFGGGLTVDAGGGLTAATNMAEAAGGVAEDTVNTIGQGLQSLGDALGLNGIDIGDLGPGISGEGIGAISPEEQALVAALAARARGEGPSIADMQTQQISDQLLRGQTAAQLSTRGALNPALLSRNIQTARDQASINLPMQRAMARQAEQQTAEQQLAEILQRQRADEIQKYGIDVQGASNRQSLQAQLEQNKADARRQLLAGLGGVGTGILTANPSSIAGGLLGLNKPTGNAQEKPSYNNQTVSLK